MSSQQWPFRTRDESSHELYKKAAESEKDLNAVLSKRIADLLALKTELVGALQTLIHKGI